MKNTISFLSASILFLCMSLNAYDEDKYSSTASGNYNSNMYQPAGKTDYNSQNQDPEQDEKIANYPFVKSESSIDPENVVGLVIDNKGTTLLGKDNDFYPSIENSGEKNSRFANLDVFSQYPNLISIEFRNLELSEQDLENICNFIGDCKLYNLSFNCCIIDEKNYGFIVDSIKKLDSLKALTLKFIKRKVKNGKPKSISIKTIESITESFAEKKNFVSLNIAFDKISVKSLNHINSLIKGSPYINQISLLWSDLAGDKRKEAYNDLADNLSSLENCLTKLHISFLYIPDECIDPICESIAKQSNLKSLKFLIRNLGEGKNGFDHASSLAKSISNLESLTNLSLQNMRLPASATQPIIKSLEKLTELTFLNLSNNDINKEGAHIFSEISAKLVKLKTLNMRKCNISAESFSEISKIFSSAPLKIACFGNNNIKESINNLQLAECDNLKFIDLVGNNISSESIMNFITNTVSNEYLQKVDLRNNSDMTKQRDQIEKLKSTNNCKIGYLLDSKKKKKKDKSSENATNANNNVENKSIG
ncbi:MAG: hypothetical protein IJ730_02175 [Alphaproteobacteria bacterium]|nr:hypothetical protein [Alphaproteobacteria bacterium]